MIGGYSCKLSLPSFQSLFEDEDENEDEDEDEKENEKNE